MGFAGVGVGQDNSRWEAVDVGGGRFGRAEGTNTEIGVNFRQLTASSQPSPFCCAQQATQQYSNGTNAVVQTPEGGVAVCWTNAGSSANRALRAYARRWFGELLGAGAAEFAHATRWAAHSLLIPGLRVPGSSLPRTAACRYLPRSDCAARTLGPTSPSLLLLTIPLCLCPSASSTNCAIVGR